MRRRRLDWPIYRRDSRRRLAAAVGEFHRRKPLVFYRDLLKPVYTPSGVYYARRNARVERRRSPFGGIQREDLSLHGDHHKRPNHRRKRHCKSWSLRASKFPTFRQRSSTCLFSNTGDIMLAELDAAGVASFGQTVGIKDEVVTGSSCNSMFS